MQKTAQKRDIFDKIREFTNISGRAAEKFFSPKFEQVMKSLREKDDKIRAIASGEQIGEQDPGDDSVSLKELLKSSKRNFNKREYMRSIAELSRFHKKLSDIVAQINNLNLDVDETYHQFLFEDKGKDDSDYKKHLRDLKTRFAEATTARLVKEAGILDFLRDMTSERGRALNAFEKKYPRKVKDLKAATSKLLSQSESTLSSLLSILKVMAKARAQRNIDQYVDGTSEIIKRYNSYHSQFKEYYNNTAVDFLKVLDSFEKVQPQETGPAAARPAPSAATTLEMPELPAVVSPTSPSAPPAATTLVPPASSTPPASPAVKPAGPAAEQVGDVEVIPPAPDTEKTLPASTTPELTFKEKEALRRGQIAKKTMHHNFFSSLQTLSDESPAILALHIKKYAAAIQNTDPETAIKLLNIVKSIRG
jgi:viroplasmin and RNaseH domain-containing protein